MKIICIHGFNILGDEVHWMQNLKSQSPFAEIKIPNFPNPEKPNFEKWFQKLENEYKSFQDPEEVIIVAHSLGGFLSLKFVEKYSINKLILVAPGYLRLPEVDKYFDISKYDDQTKSYLTNFFESAGDVDFELLFKNCKDINLISSKDDYLISPERIKTLREDLPNHYFFELDGYVHFRPGDKVEKIQELNDIIADKVHNLSHLKFEIGKYNSNASKRQTAVAVVEHPTENKILTLRWNKFDWVGLVTGGIEENETAQIAVERELIEETGYTDIASVKKLGEPMTCYYFAENKNKWRAAEFNAFYIKLNSLEQIDQQLEDTEDFNLVWTTPGEFLEENEKVELTNAHDFRPLKEVVMRYLKIRD